MSDKIKVQFKFKKNVGQFLQTKQPELLIKVDGIEKLFLMEKNTLSLELPRNFNLIFRVPYMGQYAFVCSTCKSNFRTFNFIRTHSIF